MEQRQIFKIKELASDWESLKTQLCGSKTFDYPLFKKAFEETFELLAPCSCQTTLDKYLMELVLRVRCFVDASVAPVGRAHAAAVVITERMLHHCAIKPVAYVEPVEGATIYLVDSRTEIFLEFHNLDASIDALGKLLVPEEPVAEVPKKPAAKPPKKSTKKAPAKSASKK